MDKTCGYNLKSGGQDFWYCSDETRIKIRNAVKSSYNDPNRRKIQSENALKQWADPSIKAKIIGENNGMYGRHHTEEAKRKMSEKKRGQQSWRRNKTPVLCVELDRVFHDATEAAKELSIDSCSILKVCRGERHTCGGYHWEFVNRE